MTLNRRDFILLSGLQLIYDKAKALDIDRGRVSNYKVLNGLGEDIPLLSS